VLAETAMAESKVTLETLNELLFLWFPILKSPEYARLVAGLDDGPYVIFGVIFNSYLENMVYSGHPEDWRNIGTFIENLSTGGDEGVRELLKLEILPTFLKSQRFIDTYWEHLGANTRPALTWIAPKVAPQIQVPSS
jgi:hypothetical protein